MPRYKANDLNCHASSHSVNLTTAQAPHKFHIISNIMRQLRLSPRFATLATRTGHSLPGPKNLAVRSRP
jgi:hypothetical protein